MPTRPDKKAARAEIRQLDTFTVKAALGKHLAKQSLLPVIEERVDRLHLIGADASHLWGKYVRHRHAMRKALLPKEFLRDYSPKQRMERAYELTFFRQFVAAAATGCRSCPGWLTPVLDDYKCATLLSSMISGVGARLLHAQSAGFGRAHIVLCIGKLQKLFALLLTLPRQQHVSSPDPERTSR